MRAQYRLGGSHLPTPTPDRSIDPSQWRLLRCRKMVWVVVLFRKHLPKFARDGAGALLEKGPEKGSCPSIPSVSTSPLFWAKTFQPARQGRQTLPCHLQAASCCAKPRLDYVTWEPPRKPRAKWSTPAPNATLGSKVGLEKEHQRPHTDFLLKGAVCFVVSQNGRPLGKGNQRKQIPVQSQEKCSVPSSLHTQTNNKKRRTIPEP